MCLQSEIKRLMAETEQGDEVLKRMGRVSSQLDDESGRARCLDCLDVDSPTVAAIRIAVAPPKRTKNGGAEKKK